MVEVPEDMPPKKRPVRAKKTKRDQDMVYDSKRKAKKSSEPTKVEAGEVSPSSEIKPGDALIKKEKIICL